MGSPERVVPAAAGSAARLARDQPSSAAVRQALGAGWGQAGVTVRVLVGVVRSTLTVSPSRIVPE
ncbi:hypothetical protein, partial [Micromonospora sp. NPDC005113]